MPRHLKLIFTLAVFAVSLTSSATASLASTAPLSSKELTKAEKILVKLGELERVTAASDHRSLLRANYPELYVAVSSLHDSDLKTDLATAIYLYEKALLVASVGDTAVGDCEKELRSSYRNLCTGGQLTRAEFLLAKARLHTTWAAASVRYARGSRDVVTLEAISQIARERSLDLALSARVVNVLRGFEQDAISYSSLGDFEEHARIARVSFDEFSTRFRSASDAAYSLLRSLPRNSLTYHLLGALNSYSDGLFWWQKTYRRKEAVVSANNWTEPASANPLGLRAETIEYSVVCIWRKAARHIASATTEIERGRSDLANAAELSKNATGD